MQQQKPIDHPISKLSYFLRYTAGWKQEVAQFEETLKEGLGQPGVLTDANIARVKRNCIARREDLELFEAQAARWAALPGLSRSRRSGLKELDDNLAAIRSLDAQIHDTATLLERATLEQQMSASDLDWGLAALRGELPRM
ncbi:hypothetical protein AB0F20_10190 [Streptomyces goshikiensis]|uniref:hypothetical protein n=1 Tax=Streptomyces goshikiensis TaxID=1942 RepID=UPI00340E5900